MAKGERWLEEKGGLSVSWGRELGAYPAMGSAHLAGLVSWPQQGPN